MILRWMEFNMLLHSSIVALITVLIVAIVNATIDLKFSLDVENHIKVIQKFETDHHNSFIYSPKQIDHHWKDNFHPNPREKQIYSL